MKTYPETDSGTYWDFTRAEDAAIAVIRHGATEALCYESGREKWKRVHRAERLRLRGMFEKMRTGTIGSIYGVRVLRSGEIR